MSTQPQFATTPKDELKHEINTGYSVAISDWADYHTVYPWLLPFEHRKHNPISTARKIKETLDGMPPYAQTLRLSDIGVMDMAGTRMLGPLVRLYRMTELRDTSTGMRYNNPQYEHFDAIIEPLTDATQREAFYERWRQTPTINQEFFCKHFGQAKSTFREWVQHRYDRLWGEQNRQNRERLARTLYTIYTWADRTLRSLYALIPVKDHTVRSWVRRYARKAEWKPPKRLAEENINR